MRPIGYACKMVGPPRVAVRGCTVARATPERLREVVAHNLRVLGQIIDYNAAHGITLFRISSDLVPLSTHPAGRFDWRSVFADELAAVGEKIRETGTRVSMHPGQYTVLNSPDDGVVERAVEDLQYHADVLDALGAGQDGKIVLHVGGVYGDRPAALRRFAARFRDLTESIRRRLVIENDERSFAIDEVRDLAAQLGIPAILDTLHYALLPPKRGDLMEWIDRCAATWTRQDGLQKIHYSQQFPGGKPGAHSATINAAEFSQFHRDLGDRRCAVMLEVKDKNLSAVKCLDCIRPRLPRSDLTDSWAQYKYSVLERTPAVYTRIRQFLKQAAPDALGYYALLDEALATPIRPGTAVTAFQHVWGYFSKTATPAAKKRAGEYEGKIAADLHHLKAAKGFLFKMAEGAGEKYLLNSLYFDL